MPDLWGGRLIDRFLLGGANDEVACAEDSLAAADGLAPTRLLRPKRSRSPRGNARGEDVAAAASWWSGGWGKQKAATFEDATAGEDEDPGALPCGDGCFWSMPRQLLAWQDPSCSDAALSGGDGVVEFQAALVVPGAEAPPEDMADPEETLLPPGQTEESVAGLPVAFFFGGLGATAKDAVIGRYADFAAAAEEPFVLVAACRQPGRWWFIDDDGAWGWLQGRFRPEAVELVGAWIQALAERPGVDFSRVGIFGFSAGAYAVAEVMACSSLSVPLTGVGLGGIHGHGQADLHDLPARRQEGVLENFQTFLSRLLEHKGVPWIEATHSRSDQQSRWEDASPIFGALTQRQRDLDLPDVSVRVIQDQDTRVGSRRNKAGHDYLGVAFLRPEFFTALLGGQAPEPAMLPHGLSLKLPGSSLEEVRQRPRPPAAPPPTALDIAQFSATCGDDGWVERAFEIFEQHGFVIVEELLKLHAHTAVLRDCEQTAKAMVGSERKGNRGPGRYSFGVGSSTGSMLHVSSFARHLLDNGTALLRPLLDLIFAQGETPGFSVFAAGGDFVLGDTHSHQQLHSDIQVGRAMNKVLPPPMLSVNYCVQELTHLNGPTRIVPGTQVVGGVLSDNECGEWRCSRLCPVPVGAALVRDVRTLHGGTPNVTPRARFLPSIEYVSADMRATSRKDMFPPPRSLPWKLYEKMAPEVQELCEEIVVPEGTELKAKITRR